MKKFLSLFVVAGLVCGFAAAGQGKIKPHYKVKTGMKIVKPMKTKVIKKSVKKIKTH